MTHPLRPAARRALLACVGALTILGVAVPNAAAQRATLSKMVRDTVLANGLHVIVVRNPTVPLATIEVVVRTGAFSQLTKGDEGLPHLLEHMLFKSGAGSPGSFDEDAEKAEYLDNNGITSEEAVSYYITLPSKNLEKGVKLMADLVRNPRFESDALKAEQRVVMGELQRNASEPQYLLYFASSAALWSEGWGRKNPGGNGIAVLGATTDRLKEFFRQYYIPNNSAVVVTGDVEAATVFTLAAKSFQSWKRGEDPLKGVAPAPMPPLPRSKALVVEGDVTDVTFLVRWHGPSVATAAADTYAADVFSELINQPLSGAQRRLVDSGLFQSVSLGYDTQRNVGPISLYARTTPEKLEAAGLALQKEIHQFATPGYFTDDDVLIAKKRQQVLTAFQFESATTLAHPLATLWAVAGLDYYMDYVDNVRAQTPADVQRFAQTYFAGKHLTVAVLVSPEIRRSMRSQIDGLLVNWSVK